MAKKSKKKHSSVRTQDTAGQSTLNGGGSADSGVVNPNGSATRVVPSQAIEPIAESWNESDPRYWQLALGVLVLGIALRQILLANFPYHPDEAIHAWFASADVFRTYRYDPIYHGPVMYYLTAFTYTLFQGIFRILEPFGIHLPGANDYTARLVPSLLGIGVLATILYGPMRRWIGARGALWALALVAISPVIVTYSRRLLHDSLVLLLTLTAVICFQIAREYPAWTKRGRKAWLGIAAALTLFVATKANAYFVIVMLGSFWVSTLWPRAKQESAADEQASSRAARRANLAQDHWPFDKVLQWLPISLFVFISIASYYALRDEHIERNEKLFRYACLLSVGLLWWWLHAGPRYEFTGVERDELDSEVEKTPAQRRTTTWRTALISAWASVGIFAFFYGHGWLWWKLPAQLVPVAPVPAASPTQNPTMRLLSGQEYRERLDGLGRQYRNSFGEIVGYATFKSQPPPPLPNQTWLDNRLDFAQDWDDVTMAIPRGLGYWGKQQKEPRLPGRHDYYLVLMTLYEAPIVIAAIGGIVLASRRRSPFTDLLLWWAFTSYVLYALANEKVPWLLNHIMLPFCLLGGWWLSQLRPQSTLTQRAMTLGCAAGAIFLLRGVSATNFERAVENREPMFYAQTTEDFRDALFNGLEKTRDSKDTIWIHGEKQWPPAWYLRNGAPLRGESPVGFPTTPGPEPHRFMLTTDSDWPVRQKEPRFANWKGETVYHYIWPRASWPALRPDRFWRWWAKRDALTKAEEKMMKDGVKTLDTLEDTILKTPGEWSHSTAVFASPP